MVVITGAVTMIMSLANRTSECLLGICRVLWLAKMLVSLHMNCPSKPWTASILFNWHYALQCCQTATLPWVSTILKRLTNICTAPHCKRPIQEVTAYRQQPVMSAVGIYLFMRDHEVLAVGWQVISTARTCNVILIVLDCLKPISHKKLIEKELEGFGIRLNKRPPGITFRRKDKGGVSLTTTISEPKLDLECMSCYSLFCAFENSLCDFMRKPAAMHQAFAISFGSYIYLTCMTNRWWDCYLKQLSPVMLSDQVEFAPCRGLSSRH